MGSSVLVGKAMATKNLPLVLKLQSDAMDQEVMVSSLLRQAKAVASKLSLSDALEWIDLELEGYFGKQREDLPAYRILDGTPKAFNPYSGWQPIFIPDNAELARAIARAPIAMSVPAIEADIANNAQGTFVFPYPPETKTMLQKAIGATTEMHIEIGFSQAVNIAEQARNLVLNWALELEKNGVLGEDMTFTTDEKREASSVSYQFNIQNVGVLGDVSGQSTVSSNQNATLRVDVSVEQLRDFSAQARRALDLLEPNESEKLEPILAAIDKGLDAESLDRQSMAALLKSAKTVCEGAVGNLAAHGILEMLTKFFAV